MERTGEEILVKISWATVDGNKGRERPQRWRYELKELLMGEGVE